MKQLILILKFKAIAYLRFESEVNFSVIVKNIGSGFIYTGFAVGAYFFTLKLMHFLLVDIKVGLFLLHQFISMTLFIFFLSVNVGNIIVSYSTLYKSAEVTYYFTMPVNPSKIFLIKFLDNFFYSSSTMVMIMLSVMVGYASYFNLSFASFISLIIFNTIPFILSAGSLGVIILLTIIKLASKYGIKKILYLLGLCYIFVVFLFFKINSPMHLVDVVMKYYPLIDKNIYLDELIPSIIKFLPNSWLAQTAFDTINVNTSEFFLLSCYQICLSMVLFSIALFLGRSWYFDTWLKLQAITSNYLAKRNGRSKFFSFENKSFFKPQTESILKKDLLVFLREPSQVVHISILMFLIVIFISSVSGIRYFKLGDHYLITIIYLSIILFNLLLISTFSLRFIFPLISMEGFAFWKIKSAPVNQTFYILRKLLPFSFLIVIIGQSLSLFSNIRLGSFMIILSALITLFSSYSIIAINFGMGLLFANYKEKNPIRLSSSQGASISFLITICYMFFVVLLLFKPLTKLFYAIRVDIIFDLHSLLIPLIPIMVISLLLGSAFIKSGLNSLKKDF